jgi:hypothetical protein
MDPDSLREPTLRGYVQRLATLFSILPEGAGRGRFTRAPDEPQNRSMMIDTVPIVLLPAAAIAAGRGIQISYRIVTRALGRIRQRVPVSANSRGVCRVGVRVSQLLPRTPCRCVSRGHASLAYVRVCLRACLRTMRGTAFQSRVSNLRSRPRQRADASFMTLVIGKRERERESDERPPSSR